MLSHFHRFKRTCADFAVPPRNITLLATEATRTAINSADFRARIHAATGWTVTLLAKEEEGRVGALGVATSLGAVNGLVMDLGGGSTQLTWLTTSPSGTIDMPSKGAVSLPFGAAALTRRLQEAYTAGGSAYADFAAEVRSALETAYASLSVPRELQELAKKEGGYALYLSGGGFRGWGFVLMSQHAVSPYPIPVINGLVVPRFVFLDTAAVQAAVVQNAENEDAIFRVSQRRAGQVPAVAFLVSALSEALPQIKEVRFCQGGVREGFLFSKLPDEIRAQQPLVVATQPFADPSSALLADILASSLPFSDADAGLDEDPLPFTKSLVHALANLLHTHSSLPKDLRSAAALRSTTTGVLASAHGLAHEDRALLALALCARHGGVSDLPPQEKEFWRRLVEVVGTRAAWWAGYVGTVGTLLGEVFPGPGYGHERLMLRGSWEHGKKGREKVVLVVRIAEEGKAETEGDRAMFGEELEGIVKVGKKKNWIGGRDGVGFKVQVICCGREV